MIVIFRKNFEIYHVSYLWYTLMGTVIVIIVSLLVSFITKPLNPNEVNTNLLAPFLRTLVKSPIRGNESVIYNFSAIEVKKFRGFTNITQQIHRYNVKTDNIRWMYFFFLFLGSG
jgi:hypothetical protein